MSWLRQRWAPLAILLAATGPLVAPRGTPPHPRPSLSVHHLPDRHHQHLMDSHERDHPNHLDHPNYMALRTDSAGFRCWSRSGSSG